MLSLRAISEAATSSLPDRLVGRVRASATIEGNFDVITANPLRTILFEATEMPVFAAEIYVAPLSAGS